MNDDSRHPDRESARNAFPGSPGPAPRRRAALGVGLGALGLAALVTGGMALTASRTQDTTEKFARTLTSTVQSSGLARVESSTYKRGLTSSTQVMKIALDETSGDKPVRLIVTNRIQHGPLPGLQAVGQALVDTEIRFEDPATQARLDRAFGGRKPQIRTLVGLDGGTHTTVDVPQGTISENGSSLSWQPLKARVDVQGLRSTGELNWPGLTLGGEDFSGQIGPLTFRSDTTRASADDRLGTGQGRLQVNRLTFTGAGETLAVKDFVVSTDSKLSGTDFYDSMVGYSLGEVQIPGAQIGSLKNIQMKLSALHLARAPLNRLVKVYNEALEATSTSGAQASESGLPAFTPAQEKQLEGDLLALVKGNPEIRLDRLSLGLPGGDVVLRASVTLPGAARMSTQEIRALVDTPTLAAGALSVQATLNAPRRALEELLSKFGDTTLSDLDSLISAGMLRQNGEQLSAEVRFGDGEMTFNGQNLGEF